MAKKRKSSTRCHSNQHASLMTCRNKVEICSCSDGGDEDGLFAVVKLCGFVDRY